MRHKIYISVPQESLSSVANRCKQENREWHAQSMEPNHKEYLVVIIEPSQQMQDEFESQNLAFPDVNDHTLTVSAQHAGFLQGASIGETTYQVMKRVARNFPIMDPRG